MLALDTPPVHSCFKHSGFYSVIVDTIFFTENPIFLINFLKKLMKMFKHITKEFAKWYDFLSHPHNSKEI